MFRTLKDCLDNKLSVASPTTFDSVSEISEVTSLSTHGSSIYGDTREELQELATQLGYSDVTELYQERFRVDRRKLESMLLGADQSSGSAADFFQKIMEETSTLIIWPARLKIGSKSKNDPHVRIAGRPDDVKEAKNQVMTALDVRNNRVTLKLNVSYTDHSHIIGKGGLTIKRVMEETGCHIHFPDSNRSNPMEKSNQVSIAGEMENVERARARVRELSPLMFSFELPIAGSLQPVPGPESPYLVSIQEKYNVQVMFRTRPKLHATLVIIKGCEWEVEQVKEATRVVINQMCDSLAGQVLVQMSMEISPQHHTILLGKSSSNLKLIMQRTNTQILFPDAGDPNIPSIKKSNVVITGQINNVYLARQQLLGSLPLVLMFDVPEDSITVGSEQAANLMQKLDLMITIRHKPKQNSKSVIIKGIERNANNIYEARTQLLALQEPTVKANIPSSYQLIDGPPLFDCHNGTDYVLFPEVVGKEYSFRKSPTEKREEQMDDYSNMSPLNKLVSGLANFPMSPLAHLPSPSSLSPGLSPTLSPSLSTGSPSMNWSHAPFGLLPPHSPHSHILTPPHFSQLLAQQQQQQSPRQHVPQSQRNQQVYLQHLVPWMQHITMAQQQASPGHNTKTTTTTAPNGVTNSLINGFTNDLNALSLGERNFHGSTHSLGYHSCSSSQGRPSSSQSVECPNYSSVSSNTSSVSSPTASSRLGSPTPVLSASADSSKIDISASSNEGHSMTAKRILQQQQKPSPTEYQQKKTLATKAVRGKPALEALRIPTNVWSGFGFSNSSPSTILKEQLKKEQVSQVRQRLFEDADAEDNGAWKTPSDVTPVMPFPPNESSGSAGKEQKSLFSSSNYLESLASSTVADITNIESSNSSKDLTSLLISIGMEKYINLFIEHEIDLKVFLSITDKDLREIGVNALGARRTLLMAIAQQKRLQSPFRGSAAPGAERKGPVTTIGNSSFSDGW